MKVLVTGGAGFLGHHVVRRFLELGYDVVVFDQFNSETTQSKIYGKSKNLPG